MMDSSTGTYDAFISYSQADQEWVEEWLLQHLEAAGLRICIDSRDFDVGVPNLVNIERAVDRSRHTLIVLTPAWIESEWAEFEALLVQTSDPSGRRRRLLPLLLRPCEIPARIAMLTYADFTDVASHDIAVQRLLHSVEMRAQLFISYKRNMEPDEPLALRLHSALEEAGHTVFIDQTLSVGVTWATEIERQIEASDFMLVLLSEASVHSEMVAAEVRYAHKQHQQLGKGTAIASAR
ncbi:toll/interleukin-1 receptor domain-containing protein [Chloroflexi bacterium TSY]|nr:toll/interleukin-1 receptor domain-containing protein [Chloroflexi bacterium TSY]